MAYGNYGGGDTYDRLNNTKEVRGGAKFPYIDPGRHKLGVVVMEEFEHSEDGPSARVVFEVLSSTAHKPGEYVVKIYKLVQPAKFKDSLSDADLFADFCKKLCGAPPSEQIGSRIRTLMKDRVQDQLARGMVIDCTGVANKKGTWTNLFWTSVEQSPATIAALRATMEAKGIPDTGGRPPQQAGGQRYPENEARQQYSSQQTQQYATAPAPAPAQGGFLAQLPPTNNGPQGGNTGGGW